MIEKMFLSILRSTIKVCGYKQMNCLDTFFVESRVVLFDIVYGLNEHVSASLIVTESLHNLGVFMM